MINTTKREIKRYRVRERAKRIKREGEKRDKQSGRRN